MVLVALQLSAPGSYLPPVFKQLPPYPAPDNHLVAGPNCRMIVSRNGCIGGARGGPAVSVGIVSPAGVEIGAVAKSAPDDHFTAGPHCRVIGPRIGRIGGVGGGPAVGAGIVSPAVLKYIGPVLQTHPRRSSRCQSRPLCVSFAQWARWWCWWLSNCPCRDCIARQCSK